MINKWMMEIDQGGLYNGENLHKEGDGKNIRKERPSKIYCSIGKKNLSEITNPSKYLLLELLGLKFNSR